MPDPANHTMPFPVGCGSCAALAQRVRELAADMADLRLRCVAREDAIQQALGAALGCPRYCDDPANFPDATEADGVCVGEDTAMSLADRAAAEIARLRGELQAKHGKG